MREVVGEPSLAIELPEIGLSGLRRRAQLGDASCRRLERGGSRETRLVAVGVELHLSE